MPIVEVECPFNARRDFGFSSTFGRRASMARRPPPVFAAVAVCVSSYCFPILRVLVDDVEYAKCGWVSVLFQEVGSGRFCGQMEIESVGGGVSSREIGEM